MIKIEVDKDGKSTKYEINDESLVKEEISKLFGVIHEELKSSLEEFDKAMKRFDEFAFPKLSFPNFDFPFPEIKVSFPKKSKKKELPETKDSPESK